ncbi:MAG: AAA family ATPase, partial [Bilifractor sp.]
PSFEIYENSLKVVLPVISSVNLTEDEAVVYGVLSKVMPKSISEITNVVPFGRSKTAALLKELVEKKYVIVVGRGRGTKYKV